MYPTEAIRADRRARGELRRATDELVDAETEAGVRKPIGTSWVVVAALGALAMVVVAAVGIVAWVRATDTYSDADFTAAASRTVELLLSPDAGEPGRVREVLANATGEFYDDFGQSAAAYTEYVRRHGTVAAATIEGTGVSARSDDEAVVLVAARVRYRAGTPADGSAQSSTAAPESSFRLRVVVTDDSSQLKVSAVQYLP